MTPQEKFDSLCKPLSEIKIELGPGKVPLEKHIGIDAFVESDEIVLWNLEEGLPFVGANTVDSYYTAHTLEHVQNLEVLMQEVHRTLKKDGSILIKVPHFSNPYYYSDPTHVRFFGLYSFDYFTPLDQQKLKRKVPSFYTHKGFIVERRYLRFSPVIFPVQSFFRKHILNRVFNLSPFMQEVYEFFFTRLFPCIEVEYLLKKTD